MSRFDKSDGAFGLDQLGQEGTEPRPIVQLTGQNGNAYVLIGLTAKAMRRAGCSKDHIAGFKKEAMSGDYDHLLITIMKYADVE